MRANTTSLIAISLLSAFHTPFSLRFSADLVHFWSHQAEKVLLHCLVALRSLSWSTVLNCIPSAILFGITSTIASPASPLNPDTLRRYLSVSAPTENDEYSTEYQSPVSLWIWKVKTHLASCTSSMDTRHRRHKNTMSQRNRATLYHSNEYRRWWKPIEKHRSPALGRELIAASLLVLHDSIRHESDETDD